MKKFSRVMLLAPMFAGLVSITNCREEPNTSTSPSLPNAAPDYTATNIYNEIVNRFGAYEGPLPERWQARQDIIFPDAHLQLIGDEDASIGIVKMMLPSDVGSEDKILLIDGNGATLGQITVSESDPNAFNFHVSAAGFTLPPSEIALNKAQILGLVGKAIELEAKPQPIEDELIKPIGPPVNEREEFNEMVIY